jgi:hypothetical protein
VTNDERATETPTCRVIYVGGRRGRIRREPEGNWRERLATEQEAACREMAGQGLRLIDVVPVTSSTAFQGGWTEGVWLYFSDAA